MGEARKRQPRGVPTGGEFAKNEHGEAGTPLVLGLSEVKSLRASDVPPEGERLTFRGEARDVDIERDVIDGGRILWVTSVRGRPDLTMTDTTFSDAKSTISEYLSDPDIQSVQPRVPLSDAPVREFDRLAHVGSLDSSKKGSTSYEGQGLSVSQNPEEWAEIARLGDETHWIDRPVRMLDAHEITDDQRAEIIQHAMDEGWIEPVQSYRVDYWDDEAEESVYFVTSSREEAESEVEEQDEYGSGATLAEQSAHAYTSSFPDTTAKPGEIVHDDIVLAAWVDDQRPDLDGVWWQDRLDPVRLSAPRGVIVPSRVGDFLSSQDHRRE